MAHKVKHLEMKNCTCGAVHIWNSGEHINLAHSRRKMFISSLSGLIYLEKKEMGKKNRHYIADWLVIIAHKSRLNFVKASGVQLY